MYLHIWNTSPYIFHALDQPLESLSFDINTVLRAAQALGGSPAPGRRFIHCQSFFIRNAPGLFTVRQLCTANSTSARQIRQSRRNTAAREQQACETAWRSHLEPGREAAGREGGLYPDEIPSIPRQASGQIRPRTSLLLFPVSKQTSRCMKAASYLFLQLDTFPHACMSLQAAPSFFHADYNADNVLSGS